MNRFAIRLFTLATFSAALVVAPVLTRTGLAGGDPPPSEAPPVSAMTSPSGENRGWLIQPIVL